MKLKRPSQTELNQMSHADKDNLILFLFDALEQLKKRVDELENTVKKTSQNSSIPPSMDGLKKGAATPRKSGEKSPGGQAGHKGSNRSWFDQPDSIVYLHPQGTCTCGMELSSLKTVSGECRQQIDIPEPRHEVTEYRQLSATCNCGRVHQGDFPIGVTHYISYGARLKSYAVGLALGHFVSVQRVGFLIQDQYGIQPSSGSIQTWLITASERLKPTYEACKMALTQADVAHFDESGLRVNGKLNWLHVAVSNQAVYYTAHEKHGLEAMNSAGILPEFTGVAVHDHWKSYWHFSACIHALCNAHHLRELNYFEELTGHYWPIGLRQVLIEGKNAVETAKQAGKTSLEPITLTQLIQRYDHYVSSGLAACPEKKSNANQKRRIKQDDATNFLIRLRDFKSQVLRYLTDWQVPFDNNLAERMVRPIKVKLKVSGGFRAFGGSEAFCVLRSVWETNKLQGQNPFDTFRSAFAGG